MTPDLKAWVDARAAAFDWKQHLKAGDTVRAVCQIVGDADRAIGDDEATYSWVNSTVYPDEVGRVIRPHYSFEGYWLIEWGKRRRWFCRYAPESPDAYGEYHNTELVLVEQEAPINVPELYDARLL